MTTRALLDPQAADKLAKICGKMLGSAHDGERATAAAKADALVRAAGLTWSDVIAPPIIPDARRDRMRAAADSAWRRMVHFCHNRRRCLTERERAFVETMTTWRADPTDRQVEWLIDVYSRICREAAA
jgi:hypothetical protein